MPHQNKSERSIKSDRFMFIWQVLGDDHRWKPTGHELTAKLEALPIKESATFLCHRSCYTVTKISRVAGIRCNDRTQRKRHLRRILVDRDSGCRVNWECYDQHRRRRIIVDQELSLKLSTLNQWDQIRYTKDHQHYTITKRSARQCIRIHFDGMMITKCYTLRTMDRSQSTKQHNSSFALYVNPLSFMHDHCSSLSHHLDGMRLKGYNCMTDVRSMFGGINISLFNEY